MKKIFLIILFLFQIFKTEAQFIIGGGASKNTTKSDGTSFTKSQFWLGFKGGVNASWAKGLGNYQIFQSMPSSDNFRYEKAYNGVQFPGFQAGLTFIYNFRSFFSVIFEPTYSIQKFSYTNSLKWSSTQPAIDVTLTQKNTYSVHYLEFPVYARIDLFKNKLKPYILGGIIYSYLTHVSRSSDYTSSDAITGANNIIENSTPEMATTPLFIRSNFWAVAGIGVCYDINNIRVGLNVLYKSSLNNITSHENRYSNAKLTASGDVLDDMYLRNIETSLYCVFPMKFLITNNLKHVNP